MDWLQWCNEALSAHGDAHPATGRKAAPARWEGMLDQLREALQRSPACLGIRAMNAVPPVLEEARRAESSDEAWAILTRELAWQVRPAADWHGQPEPAPVIWEDSDATFANAVLSEGELAILAAAGGTGKSFLTLALAAAAAGASNSGSGIRQGANWGAACGLRVRSGPVLLVSYEDAPNRIAARFRLLLGEPAPEGVQLLPDPPPLFEADPDPARRGQARPSQHWARIWDAARHLSPSLVVIDPASMALADVATSEGGPVRAFLAALMAQARAGGWGVLVVAHDTKAARNETHNGGDPGAGAIAGAAAWHDQARGALYLRRDPADRARRLLECIKSNYGRTGWGARLSEAATPGGAFAGYKLERALDAPELAAATKGRPAAIETDTQSKEDPHV